MNTLRHTFLVFTLLVMAAQPLLAQDTQDIYYRVDYMKVEQGAEDTYTYTEEAYWKPVHQKLVDEGKINGWALYGTMYPYGTEAEYNYITVTSYVGFAASGEGLTNEMFASAHPGKSDREISEMITKTLASRELVKSELWLGIDGVPANAPVAYMMVNFVQPTVPAAEYVAIEQEVWKPVHMVRQEEGHAAGWGMYQKLMPGGTAEAYSRSTIDFYSSYDKINSGFTLDIFKTAHPTLSDEELQAANQKTGESRDFIKTELWSYLMGTETPVSTAADE